MKSAGLPWYALFAVVGSVLTLASFMKVQRYGFRGSDPELMNAVINKLEVSGSSVEYLASSWRSRPALVELTNELFAPAFSDYLKKIR